MKYTLALAVALATVAVVCNSSVIKADPRANLIVGSIVNGDRQLYTNSVSRAAAVNTVQSQDLIWRGNITNRITLVRALEVGQSQNASARILSGGIGWNNVTVRFQSARGRGYYYLLEIWGR